MLSFVHSILHAQFLQICLLHLLHSLPPLLQLPSLSLLRPPETLIFLPLPFQLLPQFIEYLFQFQVFLCGGLGVEIVVAGEEVQGGQGARCARGCREGFEVHFYLNLDYMGYQLQLWDRLWVDWIIILVIKYSLADSIKTMLKQISNSHANSQNPAIPSTYTEYYLKKSSRILDTKKLSYVGQQYLLSLSQVDKENISTCTDRDKCKEKQKESREIDELRQYCKKIQGRCKELVRENQRICAMHQGDNRKVREDMENIKKQAQKKYAQMQNLYKLQISSVTTQLTTLKQAHQISLQSLQQLQTSVCQKSLHLASLQHSHNQQVSKLKQQNNKLSQQFHQCTHNYAQLVYELEAVRARNRELEGKMLEGEGMEQRMGQAVDKLRVIEGTYLDNKHQLESTIKFLTEQLAIWSQKHQQLRTENSSLGSQLLNYKSMYKTLTYRLQQSQKQQQQSQLSQKSSQKDQRALVREIEGLRTEISIMREEKEKIQGMLNGELEKRRGIIEELIREKMMLYGGRGGDSM